MGKPSTHNSSRKGNMGTYGIYTLKIMKGEKLVLQKGFNFIEKITKYLLERGLELGEVAIISVN